MAKTELVKAEEINLKQLTQEAAWQLLSESDRIQCEQIKTLHVNRLLNENEWWWELGSLAVELSQLRNDAKSTIQGAQKLDLVSLALGWEDTVSTRLKDAAFIVDRWGTKENYMELINMHDAEGWRLSFYHIRAISRVQDNTAALEYAQYAIDNRLSVKELQKYITSDGQPGRKQGAGRPMSVPKNAVECIRNMIKKLEALPRSFKEAWFSNQFNLTEAIEELDDETINNPTFLRQLDTLNSVVSMTNAGLSLTMEALKPVVKRADWSLLEGIEVEEVEDDEEEEEPAIIDTTAEIVDDVVDDGSSADSFELDEPTDEELMAEEDEDAEEDLPPPPIKRKSAIPAKKDMLSGNNRSRIRR
ncbi:MAG: hypothetical protein WDA42_00560 [Candidatus Bathyarchaeia archaeon]